MGIGGEGEGLVKRSWERENTSTYTSPDIATISTTGSLPKWSWTRSCARIPGLAQRPAEGTCPLITGSRVSKIANQDVWIYLPICFSSWHLKLSIFAYYIWKRWLPLLGKKYLLLDELLNTVGANGKCQMIMFILFSSNLAWVGLHAKLWALAIHSTRKNRVSFFSFSFYANASTSQLLAIT